MVSLHILAPYATIVVMGIMQSLLPWIQITTSCILILSILLQQTGASAGSAFGGGEASSIHTTRRGFEKVLFVTTIVVAIVFVTSTVLTLIFPN